MNILSKEDLVDFIEHMAGSITPLNHNVFFNAPNQTLEEYLQGLRNTFARENDLSHALISLVKDEADYTDFAFREELVKLVRTYASFQTTHNIQSVLLERLDKGFKYICVALLEVFYSSAYEAKLGKILRQDLKEDELMAILELLSVLPVNNAKQFVYDIQKLNHLPQSTEVKIEINWILNQILKNQFD
ncbi:MAG: hypothetical protein MK212_10205 [Saprospiraceae bacterium]|nr:hypothetical protein [Saprospiraceae bacterium]